MKLTRKLLKTMGLTEEQADTIFEAHNSTLEEIAQERDGYKADAEKLPGVQKQLDDLKKEDWKQKYEDEVTAHNTTKETHQKEANAGAVKKAVEAYFKGKGVQDKHMKHAMLYAASLLGDLKTDKDGKITDTTKLDDLIKGDVADFVTTTEPGGSNPQNPPSGGGNAANPTAAQIVAGYHANLFGEAKK